MTVVARPGRFRRLVPELPATLAALAVAAVVTATGLLLALRPGSRAAFRAAMVVAVVDVALLVARGGALT